MPKKYVSHSRVLLCFTPYEAEPPINAFTCNADPPNY